MKISITIDDENEYTNTIRTFIKCAHLEDETGVEFIGRINEWMTAHILTPEADEVALLNDGWQKVWLAPDGIEGWWWIHPAIDEKIRSKAAAKLVMKIGGKAE